MISSIWHCDFSLSRSWPSIFEGLLLARKRSPFILPVYRRAIRNLRSFALLADGADSTVKKERPPLGSLLVDQMHLHLHTDGDEPERLEPVESYRLAHVVFGSKFFDQQLAGAGAHAFFSGLEATIRETAAS